MRKKLRRLKRTAIEKENEPPTARAVGIQTQAEEKENDVAVKEVLIARDSEDVSEERSDASSSDDASNTDEEVRKNKKEAEVMDGNVEEDEGAKSAPSFSKVTRESLCLRTDPADSADVALHPILVEEWTNWMHKGLYEGEEEDEKKREEEENKQREVIMNKFPRKEGLFVEAPKLNPEILAYMSGTAKSKDKHFTAAQNALAMVAVAKSISLILELEEGEISSKLLQNLGNAGKLMAGLHYQNSVMRRAFVIPGIDEKYRDLLRKSDITSDLFGEDLFKRLKHTKSLSKVVEELTPHQRTKKPFEDAKPGKPEMPAKEIQGLLAAGSKIKGAPKISPVQGLSEEILLERQEVDEIKPLQTLKVSNVAGRLRFFQEKWKLVTKDKFVQSCIKGYFIRFESQPSQI
ncbi:hypothetical protein ALC62_12704 [Cyphomyrmex costatus]|uniref:Uncharacterized protein n=1 Tax=Cyphomyrmex costatus TaxID=456900 RepID=A0A195C740_9HYME|nr:hypothetical protein ALC62_12704 [Cyphomyrmex costatus]